MKKTFLKTISGAAITLVLLATLVPARKALSQDGGGRLEGTWNVQLSVRNCQTGAVIRTFPEMATFMSGGTMIDSTSGVVQSLKTPGQGVWSHVSGNTYRFSFKSFNFNCTDVCPVPPAGTFAGWTIVTQEANLSVDATEYSSAGNAEVFDSNGNLIFTGCSTTTATRFE